MHASTEQPIHVAAAVPQYLTTTNWAASGVPNSSHHSKPLTTCLSPGRPVHEPHLRHRIVRALLHHRWLHDGMHCSPLCPSPWRHSPVLHRPYSYSFCCSCCLGFLPLHSTGCLSSKLGFCQSCPCLKPVCDCCLHSTMLLSALCLQRRGQDCWRTRYKTGTPYRVMRAVAALYLLLKPVQQCWSATIGILLHSMTCNLYYAATPLLPQDAHAQRNSKLPTREGL